MSIYLDLVMALNFVVDGLLLVSAGKLVGFGMKPGRVVAASALGGIYGGACLLPGFSFLGGSIWRVVSLGLMGWTAYGWHRQTGKLCGVFLLLSLALGGLVLGRDQGGMQVLLGAAGIWLLCRAMSAETGEYLPMELTYGGKTLHLTALRDSGNGLTDPVTGEPVVVISAEAATQLTGISQSQLDQPLETLAAAPVPGLRLIPCRTVNGRGMLLALRFPEGKLAGRSCRPLVAFAPAGLGEEGSFQALTGGRFG